jgi:hypothetical protein
MKLINILSEIILVEAKLKVVEGIDYIKVPSWSNDIEIVIPLTHNGSKKYGMYTKWCTSVDNPKNFNSYVKDGVLIYFIMKNEIVDWRTKSKEIVKTNNKYAWYIPPYNGKKSWWNINDKKIRQPFKLPKKTMRFIDNIVDKKKIEIKEIEEKEKTIYNKLVNGIDLNNDETIYDNNLDLRGTNIKSLGKLKRVNGGVRLDESNIEDLGDLEYVGGGLFIRKCKNIKSLGKVKHVGDAVNLWNSDIEDLGDLEYVGGYLDLRETKVVSFDKLKYVAQDIYFDSPLTPKDFAGIAAHRYILD